MSRTPLGDRLRDIAGKDRLRFHMPGHKGRGGALLPYDITEIPGADNLHDPRDVIAESQAVIADLYGAKASRLLVGGTTAGILAVLLAGAGPEGRVLIPTNVHRSVFAALHIGRLTGHFVDPVFETFPAFPKAVTAESVERALEQDPDIQGMMLTSPTYYGTASDVAAIAEVLHRRGKWLAVDEAHGAHLAFWHGGPPSAVACGADAAVSSTHKILGAPTMGSVLLMNSGRIDLEKIDDWLSQIESSSPSYLLMAGIEKAVAEGAEKSEKVFEAVGKAHDAAVPMFSAPDHRLYLYSGPSETYDRSKWLFGVRDGSGLELAKTLREKYGLYFEIETPDTLLAMTGIGTTEADLAGLAVAMQAVDAKGIYPPADAKAPALPPRRFNQALPFWQAVDKPRMSCPLARAAGKIAGQMLIPYPPGVPLALPGDRLPPEIAGTLAEMDAQGLEIMGVDRGQIQVLQ
jgi:arginine decarboxylase